MSTTINQTYSDAIRQIPSASSKTYPSPQGIHTSLIPGASDKIPSYTHIYIAIENSSNELVQGLYLMYNNIHGSSKDKSKTSMKNLTSVRTSDTIPQC
jgi:hypothetical protein